MVYSVNGQNDLGLVQGQAKQAVSDSAVENNAAKQDTLRLQQELDDRTKFMQERIGGANKNLQSSIEAYEDYKSSWNVFRKMGSESTALQKQIETERKYRDKLVQQEQELIKTQNRTKELIKKGEYALAKAVLEGKEQEYKQKMLAAGKEAQKGYQSANKDLEDTDRFLGKVETGMRYTRDGCVIAGAIIATGGAAAGGFAAAAAAGTAAGTVIGGTSNLARAVADQSYGTGNYGLTDALKDTGKDALTSVQIGLSGGAGAGAAKGVGSLLGKEVLKQTGGRVIVGMTAGGASGFTGSVLQTGTNIAMGKEERSWGQIAADTARGTVVGAMSGGIGAKGQAVIDNMAVHGTNTLIREVAVRATADVVAPTAISVGSSYGSAWLTGSETPTLEQVTQEASMAILSSYIGAKVTQNQQSGRQWHQDFTEAPTLSAVGSKVVSKLYAKQTPPPPAQQSKPTTSPPPTQQTEVESPETPTIEIKPKENKSGMTTTDNEPQVHEKPATTTVNTKNNNSEVTTVQSEDVLVEAITTKIEELRNNGSLLPEESGAIDTLEFLLRNKIALSDDSQLPQDLKILVKEINAARELAKLNTVDTHPDDRSLIYGHVVNYKDTPQASVDGALQILRGNMRPSGTGEVWLWTITGDVNNIPPQNRTEIELQNTDSTQLVNFNGQFPKDKVAFLIAGDKNLRTHVTEQGKGISHGGLSIFDPYQSPYLAEVLYSGDISNPNFKLLENQVRITNEYRKEQGLPPIELSVWHGLNSDGSPNITPIDQS
ncbi:MAG: hypothetical protein HYZ79_09295 [Candidatus Melainabacteria bacterium]|nr:hypothetical protein [Candidatus Melainabacteria bacterium]